jgi:hypothetical protein
VPPTHDAVAVSALAPHGPTPQRDASTGRPNHATTLKACCLSEMNWNGITPATRNRRGLARWCFHLGAGTCLSRRQPHTQRPEAQATLKQRNPATHKTIRSGGVADDRRHEQSCHPTPQQTSTGQPPRPRLSSSDPSTMARLSPLQMETCRRRLGEDRPRIDTAWSPETSLVGWIRQCLIEPWRPDRSSGAPPTFPPALCPLGRDRTFNGNRGNGNRGAMPCSGDQHLSGNRSKHRPASPRRNRASTHLRRHAR